MVPAFTLSHGWTNEVRQTCEKPGLQGRIEKVIHLQRHSGELFVSCADADDTNSGSEAGPNPGFGVFEHNAEFR